MSPPREIMLLARHTGGRVEKCATHWDAERGGRMLELVVFWPEQAGYDGNDATSTNERTR